MADLVVDDAALDVFARAVAEHASLVGAECVASGRALGSGIVQDALGNVSLVLAILDQALADSAATLSRDARSTDSAWSAADDQMSVRRI